MRVAASLLRSVLLSILGGAVVAWWVAESAFPLEAAQTDVLRTGFLLSVPAQLLVVAAAVWAAALPIERGLALAPEARGPGAIFAAHRLPSRCAAAVLVSGAVVTLALVLVMNRAGVPADLAVAGAGVGLATAILAAMLSYSIAAASAARVFEELGSRAEAPAQGTVRGKILVLGFGLNTIAALLFAPTGYVRYRADVDREYVAAAVRAQGSALVAAAGGPAGVPAEQVWLATGAPTALLDPAGAVAIRFGAAAAAFEPARRLAAGQHRAPDGWTVVSAAAAGARLVTWLPEEPLQARRKEFWVELAGTMLVVYAATAALAFLAARAITLPFRSLGRAADRIASGDLTASPPSVSRDEMGQLAADFRRMAQGLKALVVDVQAASEGVSVGAREAGAIGERVRSGALDQHAGVLAVQAAVEAMEGSVSLVSRGVGGLSDYAAATGRAVQELASAHEEVKAKGAELEKALETALRDVEHLGSAGREAEGSLQNLEALAGHAGGTLGAVKASVAGLERASGESESTAALVVDMAERAGGVVEETVHGIEALRAAVSDAHRRITALGRRSDDIHQVVDFISEVAGRTNLLSLNASIIAAQAGEHGKAFAVVADQIRDLAAQIARSTKSIGDIIHSVREDVEATAALIDRGDALAVEGVQLARNSLDALALIRRSTAAGKETASAIRSAVEAHAQSSREMSQLVEGVAEGSRTVSAAVQLVGRSVSGVNSVSRTVKALADQIARALEEQSGLGRQQADSLSRFERMIAEITRAVENHDAATRRVREALQNLSHTAGEHEAAVEGLSGVADRLGSRARALQERVGRFRV
jgi:methyl-accepting chemotaxis protein